MLFCVNLCQAALFLFARILERWLCFHNKDQSAIVSHLRQWNSSVNDACPSSMTPPQSTLIGKSVIILPYTLFICSTFRGSKYNNLTLIWLIRSLRIRSPLNVLGPRPIFHLACSSIYPLYSSHIKLLSFPRKSLLPQCFKHYVTVPLTSSLLTIWELPAYLSAKRVLFPGSLQGSPSANHDWQSWFSTSPPRFPASWLHSWLVWKKGQHIHPVFHYDLWFLLKAFIRHQKLLNEWKTVRISLNFVFSSNYTCTRSPCLRSPWVIGLDKWIQKNSGGWTLRRVATHAATFEKWKHMSPERLESLSRHWAGEKQTLDLNPNLLNPWFVFSQLHLQ